MPATKAPREKLTLRDGVDLYELVNRYVEDHIDEIELNGGALPDDLAALLDEVDAAVRERVDALAFKIDEFTGHAAAAKATKDRAARREKVALNTVAALKAYGKVQAQRAGGRLEGYAAVLRLQRNSAPATECTVTSAELLAIYDSAYPEAYDDPSLPEGSISAPTHPLLPYITIVRVATLDVKALAAAYEARRAELEELADHEASGWKTTADVPAELRDAAAHALSPNAFACSNAEFFATARAVFIADNLAAEFPGVRCERGHHLRID